MSSTSISAVLSNRTHSSTNRWLQVVSHLDPRFGGIASSMPRLCHAMSNLVELPVAGFCDPSEIAASEIGKRCSVVTFPRGRARWMFDRRLQDGLRDVIGRADGLHIHGIWEEHCAAAAAHAQSLERPYIVSAHGMLESWAIRDKGFKKLIYSTLVERNNLARAVCLRALTRTEVWDYRRLGLTNPVALIPNGVDVPAHADGRELMVRFPQFENKRLVLYMGRFHHKKGLDLLCRAWSRINRGSHDAHLVLAGHDAGQTAAKTHKLVEELGIAGSVTFTGMLAGSLKWSALAAATLFVLPSRSEGFSLAVLEAMGMGVPSILTRACNFPEIEQLACGWVVDPDEEQIREALLQALSASSSVLDAMRAKGRELVRTRYQWSLIGTQMAQVYDWILGGPMPECVEVF